MTWSRSSPVKPNGSSTVAAATLPTSQHLPAHPQDIQNSVLTLNTNPQLPQQPPHPAQFNIPHAQRPTPCRRTPRDNAFCMAVNNAATARRRKLKKLFAMSVHVLKYVLTRTGTCACFMPLFNPIRLSFFKRATPKRLRPILRFNANNVWWACNQRGCSAAYIEIN